jgi:hypothetical protein
MLLHEEICNLKAELADSKRTLRELQLKEIERNGALNCEKQLQIKHKEVEMY